MLARRGWIAVVAGALVVPLLAYASFYILFPYGRRPAIMPCMIGSLRLYALDHDGFFPMSRRGPYEALSALYPQYCSHRELAGVSGNIETALSDLRALRGLGPASSSWIYVQGLRIDDPEDLAVLWESKVGLYANGRRSFRGSRAVLLLGGRVTNILSHDWPGFAAAQERARSAILASRGGAIGAR